MSELNHKYENYKRGSFVEVLHERMGNNNEISEWWRPALWMGHDGKSHYVRYTDGSKQALNSKMKLKLYVPNIERVDK